MKVRAFATVCLIAAVGLLDGCAGTPDGGYDNWDAGNRPQMLIPGAVRSDVKGLAMGSARSKGWTIVKSSDDRLVMQRPLDIASPSAQALGAANSAIPPVIEVTSAFFERSDGVNVALGAALITQGPGDKAPQRVDYTETYREALTQSLESLRASWTANRQRLASAIPPLPGPSAGVPSPDAAPPASDPLARTWGEAVAPSDATQPTPAVDAAPPETAPAPEPRMAPAQPAPAIAAAPQAAAAPPPASRSTAVPTPRQTSGPAPVVDGSRALSQRAGPATTGAPQTAAPGYPALPAAETGPIPPEENMLTLSQATGTGTWAYYAEQYARLRGCNVTDQGAQLIEGRADGEIHKVACTGADSFLLKCQNGVCRGLE